MWSNKAFRLFLSSLVFFVLCQVSNVLLGEPAICNTGIGLGIEIPVIWRVILIVLTFTIACLLFRNILQNTERLTLAILFGGSFLFGGALSNIADRVLRGCVPDFFALSFFPAFNMADIGISVGVFILLFSVLKKS